MEWISLIAVLPALLLFGNGHYLQATAALFVVPLWFINPTLAGLAWLAGCWVALRRRPAPRRRR